MAQLTRRVFGLGITAGAAALALPATAQSGGWLRADSPGFIVYSNGSQARLESIVHDLESFDGLLRRATGAPAERSPVRLEIYLFDSAAQFQQAFPGASPDIRGFYQATIDLTASYAIFQTAGGLDAQAVLFHEYSHHFMFQYFANAYPAWYVEGFAEFMSTTQFSDTRIVMGRSAAARSEWLFDGAWMPMEQLISSEPFSLRTNVDTAKFYAQSWLFTHYIFMTHGALEQFQAYIRALRTGAAPADAFQTGFGITPAAMQTILHGYLEHSPHEIALTRPVQVAHDVATVTPMPASANALMAVSTQVRRGVGADREAALLQQVRRLAGDPPPDRFALMTLAHAEATMGDHARARTLLQPYADTHPDDAEAQYLLGLSYYEDAQAAQGDAKAALYVQARHFFSTAHRIDGNYVPALFRYAQTYNGAMLDDATADNILNVLLLSHQLAPQIPEITFYTADVLMFRNRAAEAVPLLRSIAYDPHGGDAANQARTELARAEAAARSQVAPTH